MESIALPATQPRNSGHQAHASFGVALTLAATLHLVGVLVLASQSGEPKERVEEALEVLLLRHAAPTAPPAEPLALAQRDRRGTTPEEPALSAVSELVEAEPEQRDADEPVPSSASGPTAFRETSALPETTHPPLPDQQSVPQELAPMTAFDASEHTATVAPGVDAGQILLSRNAEIARLHAQVRERSAAYARRPRRKAISASTREYKYASYLEAWRRKVEHIGNLNYPEAAKQRRLYGSLILHVGVRADGQVEGIRVLRSSGYKELDEAAVRIVELAAPYAPFPPDIRAEVDVLDINRTWQFLHGNRLGWKD